MKNDVDLITTLNEVSAEKGIDRDTILEAIESSIMVACKKNYGTTQNISVSINRETGKVDIFAQKEVVEIVEDPNLQISLEDAKKISIKLMVGDTANVQITTKDMGRVSAQTAKQIVQQKFRDAERNMLFDEYLSKERDILTGIVQRIERGNVYITLGKVDVMLPRNELIPGEEFKMHDRVKVYIYEVKQTTKGPHISISRTHPEFVKRLFEQEVPEIFDGTVEVKAIAREAGFRTKMAVFSKDSNVDAVGACVGMDGNRTKVVVNELNGEKIDIVNWSSNLVEFVKSALSPSAVTNVEIDSENQSALVIVPDNMLSLAIGKSGQNARLAAKLTGLRIDIKSESSLLEKDETPQEIDEEFEDDSANLYE